MDRWLLLLSTLLAAIGAVWGMRAVHHGVRSRWTVVWMGLAFVAQLAFLSVRGEMRGACPLRDLGEILAFLAWSLTLFYLAIGPAFRLSLLGVFTAPLVVVFQGVALLPSVLQAAPTKAPTPTGWGETHAAMSVLAYGALGVAAVAGVMFLILDQQLKDHHLKSGLFRNLPPVRELLRVLIRILRLGVVLLTVGVVAGFMMPHTGNGQVHLIVACVTWGAYIALLAIHAWHGLTGRRLSLATVALFLISLSVFAFV